MSDTQATEAQPATTRIGVDQDELLRRGLAHPVAGPHLQVIMRDLALEQAYARIAEMEKRAGESASGAAGAAKPGARSSRPTRRKAAAAGSKPAPAGTPPTE